MADTTSLQSSFLSGNPALDAAALQASKANNQANINATNKSIALEERLYVSRPRSTSNDVTNRGQHGYLRLKGSVGQDSLPKKTQGAESDSYARSLSLLTSGTGGSGYDKFLITSVSSSMDEKVQITEVFGDTEVAYYFGRSPMMFTVTGTLVDSPDNSWFTDWVYAYNDIFRGSKLAQKREQISLVMPNMTLDGAMTNFSWEQGATNDVTIGFRFTMLVTTMVPTPALPIDTAITDAAKFIDFTNIPGFSGKSQINQIKNATSVIQSPSSSIADKAAALNIMNFMGPNRPGPSLGLSAGQTTDGGLFSAVTSYIDSLTGKVTSGLDKSLGPNSFLGSISSSLSTIRANLFLPVYGVMNSLTKLVGAVFGAGGINTLLTNLTAPVRNILGDITRFANQAVAIANMITTGTATLGRNIKSAYGITQSYKEAAAAIHKASGVLAALPGSVGDSVQQLFNGGSIPASAAFLQSNQKATLSRTPSLGLGHAAHTMSPQLSILSRGTTTHHGAYL